MAARFSLTTALCITVYINFAYYTHHFRKKLNSYRKTQDGEVYYVQKVYRMSLFLMMWLSPKLYSHTTTMAQFYNNNEGPYTNKWGG